MIDQENCPFDLKLIKVLGYLCENDCVSDHVLELISDLGYQYRSMRDKTKLLENSVNRDVKTGLLKYRDDYLETVLKAASRFVGISSSQHYHVSYARLDLDDFTYLNTRYGHAVGDKILKDVAEVLSSNSRPTDLVIRFGGEEFDLMLPGTDQEGAKVFLKKIHDKIRLLSYDDIDEGLGISASSGLAVYTTSVLRLKYLDPTHIKQEYELLQSCADDALYDAKLAGKDRFSTFSSDRNYEEIRTLYAERTLQSAG